jgi:uncharacterized protein YkwD
MEACMKAKTAGMMLVMAALAGAGPAATQPGEDWYKEGAEAFFRRPDVKDRIGKEKVDVQLLEAAIFHQTNLARVALKLPVLKHSWAMQWMARQHSTEMAALQYFEHTSPVPENRTMGDRLKKVGLVNVTAAENIAVLPAKEMGSGSYIIRDNPDGSEVMIDQATGAKIDYCTYEGLAKAVVAQWMNSPTHRKNIVDKRYQYLGIGVGRGLYDKGQDSFYMTQNFTSAVNAGEAKAEKELQETTATRPGK